ncbi:hypothetical protein KKA15_05990 [Patescibacteria group bacterium]|nr:hypothetical protein [Patescibacteria group bacterium]
MKKVIYPIIAIFILAILAFGWYITQDKQPTTNQNINSNQAISDETSKIPSPNCKVEGTIKNIEFKEAWKHPCLDPETGNPFACPTDVLLGDEAQYILTVDISASQCNDLLPQNSTQNISIAQVLVSDDTKLQNNQKISGETKTRGKHYFITYTLDE